MRSCQPSISIIAHNAYGVLAGVDTGHMGGVELQTPMTARWLAAEGFRVSMITWDEGKEKGHEEGRVIDGVTLFKLCRREDGIPILRFVHPRWTSLNAALNRANPDIVYYNCGDLGLGQVVGWARRNGRKVLYSVANDVDCMRSLPELKPLRERILYKYGLKQADRIVVQTRKQKDLLKNGFGLDAMVIPMPSRGFEMEIGGGVRCPVAGEQLRVLWVGRLTKQKRLEWLLDLAELCPDVAFDVLGTPNTASAYSESLKERANRIRNVVMYGRVAHREMGRFYGNAHLLCSTSVYEGFPNIFLEAWSLGIPLITVFDPDDVVATYGHGVVADDVEGLRTALRKLADPVLWKKASKAARNYFRKFHQVDDSMQKFKAEFMKLA